MPSHSNSTGIVTIEGLIGAGKTTLCNILKEKLKGITLEGRDIVFVDEPVDVWSTFMNDDGVPILTLFYADPKKWAFSFQMMAYISRLAALKKTRAENPNAIIVSERSLEADRYVFAQMLLDDGCINTIDHKVYTHWFDTFASDYCPDLVLYLDTPIDIAESRILMRARSGEDPIKRSYLESLVAYTSRWLDTSSGIRSAKLPLPSVVLHATINQGVRTASDIAEEAIVCISTYARTHPISIATTKKAIQRQTLMTRSLELTDELEELRKEFDNVKYETSGPLIPGTTSLNLNCA